MRGLVCGPKTAMNKERRSGYCDKENQQQCECKHLPRIHVTLQIFPFAETALAATLILSVFRHPYPGLPKRLIETFGKLDSSREQFVIVQTLPCPSLHNFIDAKAFFAAKLLVQRVRVVHNFGNHPHPLVSNAEGFYQGFKGAVLAPMAESSLVHVVRNRMGRLVVFAGKNKPGFRIDEPPNQPGRRSPVNPWTWASHPCPAPIGGARNSFQFQMRLLGLGLFECLKGAFHLISEGIAEEVNRDNLLKALPDARRFSPGQ